MAVSFTTDTLISRIKRKCLFPSVNAKLTDAEILEIADEEVQTRIYGALMTVRDDYFITHRRLTYPAGARFVQLPSVISSSTIVDAFYEQPNTSPVTYYQLSRAPTQAPYISSQTQGAQPAAFTLEGDRLAVMPQPATDITILLRYERRPSRMHLAADTLSAPIVSYDSVALNFTITPTAGFITNCPVGTLVDIARSTPAFDALVQGMEVAAVASPIWTLTTGTIDHTEPDTAPITQEDVNAGDYLTLQGTTPVFPLPEVWWPVCIYSAAATACREVGDLDQAMVNAGEADRLIQDAITLAAQRIRKQPIAMFDRGSGLRMGGPIAGSWNINQFYLGRW